MLKTTLNHISVNVSDKTKSFPFYKDLLTYLGYKIIDDNDSHLGMRNGTTDIWLKETAKKYNIPQYHRKKTGLNHIAFGVSRKESVDVFCKEFLETKGIKTLYDTPKHFSQYTEKYYAVFFEDPDRIKLEIVFM